MTDIPADAIRESWDDVYEKSRRLADMIEAAGERFDAMVVIPRGGYYPANIVSRRLGLEATDMLQASIGSYEQGTTDRKGDFQLGQMPDDAQVRGKNLIVIDEVCDTGKTLSASGFKPDFAVETTDKWVVYPWEADETPAA
jgi:uncharacterized protein